MSELMKDREQIFSILSGLIDTFVRYERRFMSVRVRPTYSHRETKAVFPKRETGINLVARYHRAEIPECAS